MNDKRKYYIARHCPRLSHVSYLLNIDVIFNQYGVTVFSIEEDWVRDLNRVIWFLRRITEELVDGDPNTLVKFVQ